MTEMLLHDLQLYPIHSVLLLQINRSVTESLAHGTECTVTGK